MLPESLHRTIDYYVPDWRLRLKDIQREIRTWGHTLKNTIFHSFILFLCVVIGYAIILTLLNSFWFTFQNTQVGRAFVSSNSSPLVSEILALLSGNTFTLSLRFCREAVLVCIITGLGAQLFSLRRYFYYGHGIINHLCWMILVTAATSFDRMENNSLPDFEKGMLLYALPVCCLLDQSFKLCRFLLPELAVIFRLRELKEISRVARIRNTEMRQKR